jgi:hypothetical protein
MTNLRPVPRDQEAEALYWLDVAKRVLSGEISPDDALHVLKLGTSCREASKAKNDPQTWSSPA